MLTKNYENLLAAALLANNTVYGYFPVTTVYGAIRFLGGKFAYPGSVTASLTTTANNAGISIGTGGTAATKDDFNLENTVTGGVNLALTSTAAGVDSRNNPTLTYTVTVTNTGSEALTVREIGYKQSLESAAYPGANATTGTVCLIDRTVLETPLVIQAGDAGVIQYTLQVASAPRTKEGVSLVSFTWGSDEDVAAMIDAARNGLIDLQTDGGWRVGDVRTIHLEAFTGGASVSHAAQDLDIVITAFGDYNSCGCLFQFDFADLSNGYQKMNQSNTNAGGYGATEMYTDTLPAMAEALPEWLKTRLKTFDVLVSKGSKSTEVETVGNNKLALRSEVEVFGVSTHSAPGEGTQIPFYQRSDAVQKKTDTRAIGITGNGKSWWLRGPDPASNGSFSFVAGAMNPPNYSSSANNNTVYVSPFGCV